MSFLENLITVAAYKCGRRRALINALGAVVLACTTSFLALSAEATSMPVRLLIFGDSLTAGYGLPQGEAFPAQLQRALHETGLNVDVITSSVSGDTTAGGRARLGWALGADPASQPDAIIVELGANDALRGFDPDVIHRNLDAILTELIERDIHVLLAGMLAPPNLGGEYGKRFNAIFPRLAEAHDVALYPFFLDGVAGVPALNQRDGIHPNALGVAEIVHRITPAVTELVRAASGKSEH